MEHLSEHLTVAEAIRSTTAAKHFISNVPNQEQMSNLKTWANKIYEPIYAKFGNVYPSSVFRSAKLNSKVGGSGTSAHVKGFAGDLDGNGGVKGYVTVDNSDIFHFAIENLDFDQVIAEYEENGQPRWIHIGLRAENNRKQVLIAVKRGGTTLFLPYTPKVYASIYRSGARSLGGAISARRDIPKPDWEAHDAELVDPDLI